MKESWHAVTIKIAGEDIETASHLFHEAGCNGVLEDDGLVRAYFSADIDQKTLRARLTESFKLFPAFNGLSFEIVTSAQNDWREGLRQWFKPFEIVPGIVVAPSWEKYRPTHGEKVITLDPGMAFGTGLHETTKLCANAISHLVPISDPLALDPSPLALLDVGTGSGLLAIVARRLGIKKISAVENDPDAAEVARENFRINGCAGIKIAPSLDQIESKFDVIVANILLLTLTELKDKLIGHLAGDSLILSGITNDQEEKLENAFSPPLTLKEITRMGEWSCMTFVTTLSS